MIHDFISQCSLKSRIDDDIRKYENNYQKDFSYETLVKHVDIMHSLIHKAKEGLTGLEAFDMNPREEGIRALKAIYHMQDYIKWDN